MRRPDTLIIGGGPAGSATAITLAKAGLKPLILERERQPNDPLCGGFLSWTALQRLDRLGLDIFKLGAHRVTHAALFSGHREARAKLPAPAAALSRIALDTNLLAHAEAAGAGVERGVRVRDLTRDGADLTDGGKVAAARLVLATGKHDLPGRRRDGGLDDPVLGLRWRLTGTAGLRDLLDAVIELHCFRGGYAGLVLQEDGRANLCLAVRQSRFDEAGKKPAALLEALSAEAPSLAKRLDHTAHIADAQAVANVPYGWRFTSGADQDAPFYRVGDQAGVIASLSGEGMSLALASGIAVADAISGGADPAQFQPRHRRRLGGPVIAAQKIMQMIERPGMASLIVRAASGVPGLLKLSARATRLGAD